MKKTIKDIDLKNKKVILRCDYNVPFENGKISDDTKIRASVETINYLLNEKCSLIILSHLGKVKTKEDMENNTLEPIAKRLSEIIKREVIFNGLTKGEELTNVTKDLSSGQILLIENTRFEDIDGNKESGCDMELAKYWASLGEIFVNDAFGTIHRNHASNYGISEYLPTVIGFLIEKELTNLDLLVKDVDRPFVVLMGGAKVEDKIPLIKSIITKCDKLLLTGGIANTFLKALKYEIGLSLYDKNSIQLVTDLMLDYKDKIELPIDVIVGNKYDNNYARGCAINDVHSDEVIYDIGFNTIKKYGASINDSATIFVNGTMGKFEDDKFQHGTKETYSLLAKCPAKVIVGGGDSVSAVKEFGYENEMYFLSTGGGATLDYLTDQNLKSLSRIEDK